ncbi:HD domain-containing phosphohydrolase [Pseudoalteromonas sp. SSM20]|uniref:HD domain-containing phosphohydrolase n=1 Tax=Pseudoalteromonas sp. SSM20 TaxID=3139394 RepID=UPI003BAC7DD2
MPSLDRASALKQLLELSYRLSIERDTTKLLEDILLSAKSLCHADAGTIYSLKENNLHFETVINDSLELYLGGSSKNEITFSPIPLYNDDGSENENALVTLASLSKQTIHIPDVYSCTRYPLTQAKKVDAQTGYHTTTVLTVPMLNHEGDVNGVMQLINPMENGEISQFDVVKIDLVEALASLAAVAMTNQALIDNMEQLFRSFAELIAQAIDEKSPYTGAHCRRVPELTMMLAHAVNDVSYGPFADFKMTEQEKYALNVAGWLHDCGKIATPEYIMDKATKLETVYDRIGLINTRFDVIEKEIEIAYLRNQLSEQTYQEQLQMLARDRSFLAIVNIGGEFLSDEQCEKLAQIAERYQYNTALGPVKLLNDEELNCLQIQRGTLTDDERKIVNKHIIITIKMLESLPFPKHLRQVPEYAGGHHERMDGQGYPRGLEKQQMSVPARMMAIADIFEALTASDRPYKEAKKLSECVDIMLKMAKFGHIDPEIFAVFIEQNVYQEYADKFLADFQKDNVNNVEILAMLNENSH